MNTSKLFALGVAMIATCLPFQAFSGDSAAVAAAAKVEDAFAEVVDMAKPAVVVITNKQTRLNRTGPWQMDGMPGIPEDFFQFFNIPRDGMRRNNRGGGQNSLPEIAGKGSGVIIDAKGYILTNYHVIKDCEYLEVRTSDGKVYDNYENEKDVTIVGSDEESDLAVLLIGDGKKAKFPFLSFADSDKLRVGQWAIAIGAPFDLDYSVTIGCVSQKGRTDLGMSTFDSYIQTDASINPGNSGGPLLNIRGQIIGINQFIVTGGSGKGSIGIGFAIASNLSKKIAEELIEHGEVARPFIGVTMQELSRGMKEELGLDYGVLIRDVIPGESAEQAGIKPGDVILSVGGQKVKTSHELLMEITHYRPGDTIELELKRGDKDMKIKVKAGRRDEYIGADDSKRNKPGKDSGPVELTMKRLGLNLYENDGKVTVQEVIQGGAAERASLHNDDKIMPGDIIIDINRVPVKKIADVKKALAETNKNTIIMYLERPNKRGSSYKYFIAVSLNEKQ